MTEHHTENYPLRRLRTSHFSRFFVVEAYYDRRCDRGGVV